jgi:hypothetical protein
VRKPRDKFLADMRREAPTDSMLGVYLRWMRGEDPILAATLEADVIEVFSDEAGLRVMKLLEKSVLFAGIPNGAPDGALREANAVRNFVLEIRRIVSHG